ncbi:S41 family peptidase [Cephaloticoccus primus]|uniref:S41 family peptidase n=1 Tax=Cephaloticoccus primus TaxID=1548207 RepID=UPI0018D33857|nr:S41 family peptidase [Cephaloticoccus primus]
MLKRILLAFFGSLTGVLLALGALRVALYFGLVSLPVGAGRDGAASADYLREVLGLVNAHYVDAQGVGTGTEGLAREAIRGLVGSLDPHSEFLEAEHFQRFEEDLDGDFGGIGVQVESRSGRVVVIAPIAGTPGARAGLRRGDEIVRVDGHEIGSEGRPPMDDALKRLRGAPQTPVRVSIWRPSAEEELELEIVRERIEIDSVREARLLGATVGGSGGGGSIGYIQLVDFSARTGDQFVAALDKLLAEGAQALILDLRNNPGGLLDAAVAVVEPFFEQGELVVYTRGRDASGGVSDASAGREGREGREVREELRAQMVGQPLSLPIAVLINSGTASAAEIVTGALKDTGRAVVVGERSFGKGSVQTLFKLRDGSGLRITTSRYYTPSGVSIHGRGIEPDVPLIMTPEEDDKLRLQRARADVLELADAAEFEAQFGFAPIADKQLEAAADVLHGVQLLRTRGFAQALHRERSAQTAAPSEPLSSDALAEAQPISAR